MSLGRKKKSALSPEKKAQRKKTKDQIKQQAVADAALAKMPAEKERRDELFAEAERLKTEQQGISGKISQHRKRLIDVFGFTAQALQIRKILKDAPDGVYEATVKQLKIMLDDLNRPFQLDMFADLKPGVPVEGDQGSVFDASKSGEKIDTERKDDPGKARRRNGKNASPPPAPTPGIPLAEAEEKFTDTLRRQNAETEEEIKARARARGDYQTLQ
jgi:hypothetical protein